MSDINHKLYTATQVRGLDYAAIHEFNIAGYELMCRAGKAVMDAAGQHFPQTRHWLILCGPGNNGGDGYVLARLAAAAGIQVTVCSLIDPARLQGDAATAYQDWLESEGKVQQWPQVTKRLSAAEYARLQDRANEPNDESNPTAAQDSPFDLVMDALLGTGIDRAVEGVYRDAIEFTNGLTCPVIAIDIPSGLNADTGCVMGAAVRAQVSVSFVGNKRGMYTADGPDQSGRIVFDDLNIPAQAAERVPDASSAGDLLNAAYLTKVVKPRANNSHKGSYGEVLAVGGAKGMSGAILLCGTAALRSGAGKVRLATDPDHAAWINISRPELMVSALGNERDLQPWLKKPRVLALGPGLGRGEWSKSLLHACLSSDLQMVTDADALNLLAELKLGATDLPWASSPQISIVMTPHPAEAARLLGVTTATIQQDRIGQALILADKYQAVVVLKGSGSVIANPDGSYAICPFGNPGMATAGSGDVLTGIIAALLAQGLCCRDAACAGVLAHAMAGDLAAKQHGVMAMIAGDITRQLQHVWKAANTGRN